MEKTISAFDEASEVLVGGVNSPVRAYKSVGGEPVFLKSGKGAMVTSIDNQSYIDYVLSYGPLLAGHAPESMISDIHNAMIKGTTFGAPTENETQLAKSIRSFFPSCEKIRLVNSGTEATMSAIRLARGATKRDVIVKFNGCYHGHVDSLLVAMGSGGLTLGKPSSAGIPDDITKNTRVLEFNDTEALTNLFEKEGAHIAAIIMEPVCGNMGVVIPDQTFITACRQLCDDHGSLLIFDEVMTGFRVGKHGAQGVFNIEADITCLGKVIGGGLPCAAYGGKSDIMNHLAPIGDVYQAGTLSGNPLAVAAGRSMMQLIESYGVYEKAEEQAKKIVQGMDVAIKAVKAPIQVISIGTMFTVFFTDQPIKSVNDVNHCDMEMFNRYFHYMKSNNILIPPSQYEANFVSSEHNDDIISTTLKVFTHFLKTHF
ncbi:glutamate-1-semialdehyde-2,1-aminomutase [Candidatus Marinamargulisbacteria bacterium SCGC AG-343-K17]|nr:glutamate-1-semialdehyde-2,1-aminomutase [Candidatus Marinamargulisbacteria bacterium SCGC AG-343-K17]